MPIGVERVDFVSIPVRDLARARRFYGEVLVLPRGGPAPDGGQRALWHNFARDL